MLKRIKSLFVETFFPKFCLGCGREGEIVCEDCLSTIEITEGTFCPFCKKPQKTIRGKCPFHQNKNLDGIFAATDFNQPLVQKMIKSFKYSPFLRCLKEPLTFLIIAHFLLSENKDIFKEKDNCLFVPIPLSKKRKRWRGFNQSEEIAKELGKFFGVEVKEILVKIKHTPSQTQKNKEERWHNIENVFSVKENFPFQNKRIFLIDDVFTTGATMEEAAKTLKKEGAKEVWGIVIAREILKD